MKKIFLILSLFLVTACQDNISEGTFHEKNNNYLGILIIPSIDMIYGFYDLDNKLNDVSKNVTLINSNIDNTYILAAHSGSGNLAFFNDLKLLKEKDKVYLKFKDKINEYEIENIRSEKKTGKINIKREENQVILTTCDQVKKGNQLIIEASLKNEEDVTKKVAFFL